MSAAHHGHTRMSSSYTLSRTCIGCLYCLGYNNEVRNTRKIGNHLLYYTLVLEELTAHAMLTDETVSLTAADSQVDLHTDEIAPGILVDHDLLFRKDVLQEVGDLVPSLGFALWNGRPSRPAQFMLPVAVRSLHQTKLILLEWLRVERDAVTQRNQGRSVPVDETFEAKRRGELARSVHVRKPDLVTVTHRLSPPRKSTAFWIRRSASIRSGQNQSGKISSQPV